MIKAVILDVTGVLVGNAPGYNYPEPHPEVIERLRTIKQRGIVVSLCTTVPYFVIEPIVEAAELYNYHIINAGRHMIDPLSKITKEAPPGSMKGDGVRMLLKEYNIILDDVLGVGDSVSDWDFIKICGVGGAMGNASTELKKLVLSKGSGRGCVGGSVNENGLLDIFDYYHL